MHRPIEKSTTSTVASTVRCSHRVLAVVESGIQVSHGDPFTEGAQIAPRKPSFQTRRMEPMTTVQDLRWEVVMGEGNSSFVSRIFMSKSKRNAQQQQQTTKQTNKQKDIYILNSKLKRKVCMRQQ